LLGSFTGMARKPRVEYAGAVYHVMSRGDRQRDIFRDDHDRIVFMDTLSEVCERLGWRIHSYVLMSNHYHLLLETPQSNLVVGMKWLQGTYTQRFNSRYKEWGHLFQGRYKALLVQPDGGDSFSVLSTYIHLNPVRARLMDFARSDLMDYGWSSYPLYFDVSKRPAWLCVDRVLGNFQWRDDGEGLAHYRHYMQSRIKVVLGGDGVGDMDAEWKQIRRGWCMGDSAFRSKMDRMVDQRIVHYDRRSYCGPEASVHDEASAERLLQHGLSVMGLSVEELTAMRKSDVRKRVIAWAIRKNTCVKNDWICERLSLGHASNLARNIKAVETTDEVNVVEWREMMKKAF
jgi:putative transposase